MVVVVIVLWILWKTPYTTLIASLTHAVDNPMDGFTISIELLYKPCGYQQPRNSHYYQQKFPQFLTCRN